MLIQKAWAINSGYASDGYVTLGTSFQLASHLGSIYKVLAIKHGQDR